MKQSRVPAMSRRHLRENQQNMDGFMTGARASLELARTVYANRHGEAAAAVFWAELIDAVSRIVAKKGEQGDGAEV